jgi:superfamily II DNA/RNA helicase
MNLFAAGHVPILVATDIASRGMDVATVRTIINFDMPLNVIDYLHRIGRTGRAGAGGLAISLVQKRCSLARTHPSYTRAHTFTLVCV